MWQSKNKCLKSIFVKTAENLENKGNKGVLMLWLEYFSSVMEVGAIFIKFPYFM